jgi:Tc toxin complex TcA C-terminal TcB-binding domain/Concanavalin A-like lectin/glucanases superfamily/FHA domain
MAGSYGQVPQLVVIGLPGVGALLLTRQEMVIGHSEDADLVIDDPFVSRKHALVTVAPSGEVTIIDLNSTGGTFVNDERISSPRVLQPGDLVKFAGMVTRFETTEPEDQATAVRETPTQVLPTQAAPAPAQDRTAPAAMPEASRPEAAVAQALPPDRGTGGGGGNIPTTAKIDIVNPGPTAVVLPGNVTINGWAESLVEGYGVSEVTVSVTSPNTTPWSGQASLGTPDKGVYPWSVSVPVTVPQPLPQPAIARHDLVATVSLQSDRGGATTGEYFNVYAVPAEITVTSSPASRTVHYELAVEASSAYGVGNLQWSTTGPTGWQPPTSPLSGNPLPPTQTATIDFQLSDVVISGTPVSNGTPAANGAQLTVELQSQTGQVVDGQPQNLNSSFTITWVDRTAPVVNWAEPQDGSALELLGTATQAQTTVLAEVSDENDDAVSAGIGATGVTCTVDGATTVQLNQQAGSGTWSADVTGLAEGSHTLALDVTDNAGNSSPQQTRTVLVTQSGIQGTTEQDYLTDLVDFVHNRLLTGQGATPAVPPALPAVPAVTAGHLERALCQPFRQLAGAGSDRTTPLVAAAPINAVRGVIEVLRAYLTPAPPAPVARWPLDEGAGTLAGDDTGGGSTGTLESSQTVAWGPGPPGAAAAPVFDGTSTCMSVASTDQLAVTAPVSVAAWVNPAALGASGAGSVIIALDRWCALALGADGMLQVLADGTGTVLVDTGVPVPLSQWSHVAVGYDGTTMWTYLNGAVRNTRVLSDVTGLTPTPGPGGCQVGCLGAPSGQLFFNGSIASVGIYNVMLTPTDASLLAGTAAPAGQFPAALNSCGYLPAVYEAILAAVGTSSEELRTATRATPAVRTALAARLGIVLDTSRPDQLDQLLLMPSGTGPNALSEAGLQTLFGLQPTDADPLAPGAGTPLLQQWQQAALRAGWAAQDYASTDPADYSPPVVDPDIVFADDIADPTDPIGVNALNLRTTRLAWLASQTAALTQPSAGTGLAALVTSTLGTDLLSSDSQSLASQSAAGYDISAPLAAVPIAVDAFDRLVTLSGLPDALRDDEWDDASAIIVEVLKTRQFTAWRQEEQSLGVLLDPAVFTALALTPGQLPLWRASWSARVQWQDRLAGRANQVAAIASALASAIAAGEQAALPVLRDAVLELAVPPPASPPVLATPADQLGLTLCTDLQVGPQLTTTRVEQAADAVQVLLANIDSTGGLPALFSLPWVVDTTAVSAVSGDQTQAPWFDRFQGELSWMDGYSSWLSAMTVFLYPENSLLPSIRPTMSPQFQDFVTAVTDTGPPTSATAARLAAASFWDDQQWAGASPPDSLPAHGADQSSPAALQQYPYTEQLTSAQLATLGQAEQADNQLAAENREVFFDLPLQLALSLSGAGQWDAALNWLRVIYDLDRPLSDAWVFPVTTIEGNPGDVTRPSDWLNGGQLDPHGLASERGCCYQRFTLMTIAGILCDSADAQFTLDTDESRATASSMYVQALQVLQAAQNTYLGSTVAFIPQNPELAALTGRAASALAQLRAGLNIAGMARPLPAGTGGAPAAPPVTNFRYANLIAQAQQLVASAAQIEASYLASLQQEDNENYQQLLAGQDLSVATAQVTIAYDQASVASDQVSVAQLQVARAQTQSDTYAAWLAAGPNQYEQDQLAQIGQQQQWQNWASAAQATGAVAQAAAAACSLNSVATAIVSLGGSIAANIAAGVANAAAAGFSDAAQQAALTGQADALQASWERRSQEWSLNEQLADADVAIGQQQVLIAQGQAAIATAQASVASLNQSNAQAKLQFLQTKFTNAQLYTWMAGVLSGVYRYFLQQGAAVARLAEQQLAFERQVPVPGYIKTDYWTPPAGAAASPIGAGTVPSTGTGGLTGSARLLEDITQLNEYALDTEQRKLQLTQNFSLATLAPVDLQRFRETGVFPFAIPAAAFGTPGTYLAMIRAVRISIVALIPPVQGILGTLTSGGTSHIVVPANGAFQTVTLARGPETIVLTSPASASGVFQVDLTPELLLPFEGCGLDLPFELELPAAINNFDYQTIADVQVSIDYTALYDPDYAAQVIRQLPATTSNSILLSLLDNPDAWYAIVNQAQQLAAAPPAGTGTPPVLLATWQLSADSLPANLSSPVTEQLTLMIVRTGTVPAQFTIDHLRLVGAAAPANPTPAVTVGDIVSTRNGSGASWQQLTGQLSPVGTWELGLTGNSDTINAIASGDVQDIALVIGYTASLPAWPS